MSPGTHCISPEGESHFYNSTTQMKAEGVLLAIHWLGMVMPYFDSHKSTVCTRGDPRLLVNKA